MEISKQLAVFLHDQGFGIFDEQGLNGNIFINTIPDAPDVAFGIFTTGGPGANPGDYNRVSIQVIIRTIPNDPRGGETIVTRLINLLNGFNSDYLADGGNYIFDTMAVQTGPSSIGQDQNNRFEYSQNFIFEYMK